MAASAHPPEKEAAPGLSATPLVDATVQRAIEQFLYYEARLLDDRRIDEWYELLADDIHYFMPTRYNRLKREADREFSGPREAALFDEDKRSIAQRIRRLHTGMAWAEDPPSRTRHMITNVMIRLAPNAGEYEVDSYYPGLPIAPGTRSRDVRGHSSRPVAPS